MKLSLALTALWLCLVHSASGGLATCRENEVRLKGDWGTANFQVEIADTPDSRAVGLMHRESLPRWAGMLFLFEVPSPVHFWMKNTIIPLDMIFIDKSGRVSDLHENAIPMSTDAIQGGDLVAAVLEVNAGLIDALGIEAGTVVQTAHLPQSFAVWPCGD